MRQSAKSIKARACNWHRYIPSPLWGGGLRSSREGYFFNVSNDKKNPSPDLRPDPPHKGEGKVFFWNCLGIA